MNPIKYYRLTNEMKQVDLAQKLHVTQRTVSGYESGKISPPINKLIKISEIFGVTLDDLVKNVSLKSTT